MTIQADRLDALAEAVADLLEATDLAALVPPSMTLPLAMARMVGLDLVATARALALTSVRRLPSDAASAPDKADALVSWLRHVLEWVDGARDDPPPALTL